jgi:hypothetical protein
MDYPYCEIKNVHKNKKFTVFIKCFGGPLSFHRCRNLLCYMSRSCPENETVIFFFCFLRNRECHPKPSQIVITESGKKPQKNRQSATNAALRFFPVSFKQEFGALGVVVVTVHLCNDLGILHALAHVQHVPCVALIGKCRASISFAMMMNAKTLVKKSNASRGECKANRNMRRQARKL